MIQKISIQNLVLSLLLFSSTLFAMSVRHYTSTLSVFILLFGLIFFYKNRQIIFKDKVVLTLIILLIGFYLAGLISSTLVGWPRLSIKALEIDTRNFLVLFWLIAIYYAKDSWIWFYRSLPFAGLIIGLESLFIFYNKDFGLGLAGETKYFYIGYSSWAALLSFLTLTTFKVANWSALINKRLVIGIYILSFSLSSFVVLISLSRTAWLVYLVLIGVVLLFINKKVKMTAFIVIVAFFIIFFGTNNPYKTEVNSRVEVAINEVSRYFLDSENTRYGSADVRLAWWQTTLELSVNKPFFGYGSGNGHTAINDLIAEGKAPKSIRTNLNHTTNMHNVFFSTILDKGYVGLFFVLSIFIYLAYFFYNKRFVNRDLSLAGLIHTVGFFVMCQTDNVILVNNPGNLFLPLVFIYLVHIRHLEKEQKTENNKKMAVN